MIDALLIIVALTGAGASSGFVLGARRGRAARRYYRAKLAELGAERIRILDDHGRLASEHDRLRRRHADLRSSLARLGPAIDKVAAHLGRLAELDGEASP